MTIDDLPFQPDVLYLDTSALAKLMYDERETPALREFIGDTDLVTSALALTELPRAARRIAATTGAPTKYLLNRAHQVLDSAALVPLDYALLEIAGALDDPALRSLDAIHVSAAASVSMNDPFVSYDRRQLEAARDYGLVTVKPT